MVQQPGASTSKLDNPVPWWVSLLVLLGVFTVLMNTSAVDSGSKVSALPAWKLKVDELPVPYRTFALFVDPEQTLDLRVNPEPYPDRIRWRTDRGSLTRRSRHHWRWKAPRQPGQYEVRFRTGVDPRPVRLHVFVKVPANRAANGVLNGYRIGEYPEWSPGQSPVYRPPSGFVEVTRANRTTPVSPHFTLGEFLCKQPSSHPKYLVLRERLLLKLEAMLQRLTHRGRSEVDFTIMSGYRTPEYNRSLGNVPNSRHLWGGAADIYVDRRSPEDLMDDLNRDGETNWRDARWLSRFAPTPDRSPYPRLEGGIGVYGSTRYHGPFIHVDVRGYSARWSGDNVPG